MTGEPQEPDNQLITLIQNNQDLALLSSITFHFV